MFAVHALFCTVVMFLQSLVYPSGVHRPRYFFLGIGVFVCTGVISIYSALDAVYFLSAVKMMVSVVKYVPQVVMNWKRGSTFGWSVWNVVLDFLGGVFSILQGGVDAKWGWGMVGNPVKFGLGGVSIFFDIVFITQYYIYSSKVDPELDVEPERETDALLSDGVSV